MTTRRTVRAAGRSVVAVAALALAAACSPTGEPDASEAVGRGQLTEDQVRSALPGDDQTPPDFTVDTAASEPPDPDSTTYPAVCDDVRLQGRAADDLDEHEVASAKKSYVGDNGRGVLSVKITSYDEPVPTRLFDDAGAAQGRCGTFQIIDRHGTSDWKLAPVSVPPVGDRTYSVRVENTTKGDTFEGGVVQVATASVGHNRVHVVHSAGAQSTYRREAVETLVRTTVDNLNAL